MGRIQDSSEEGAQTFPKVDSPWIRQWSLNWTEKLNKLDFVLMITLMCQKLCVLSATYNDIKKLENSDYFV